MALWYFPDTHIWHSANSSVGYFVHWGKSHLRLLSQVACSSSSSAFFFHNLLLLRDFGHSGVGQAYWLGGVFLMCFFSFDQGFDGCGFWRYDTYLPLFLEGFLQFFPSEATTVYFILCGVIAV
jgi:hypothetical protein